MDLKQPLSFEDQLNRRKVRGKHWTTDAGYHEIWGQILGYCSDKWKILFRYR